MPKEFNIRFKMGNRTRQANFQDSPMKFLYPSEGSIIKIPRKLDGSEGKLTCSVAHPNPDVELFWHCDGQYIATTSDIHVVTFDFEAGIHSISVVDSNGNRSSVNVNIMDYS